MGTEPKQFENLVSHCSVAGEFQVDGCVQVLVELFDFRGECHDGGVGKRKKDISTGHS
jgi:hypothetical protein